MYTLRDVLRALQRLDVGPEEVEISLNCFEYLMHRAKKVTYEEENGGDFIDDNGEF